MDEHVESGHHPLLGKFDSGRILIRQKEAADNYRRTDRPTDRMPSSLVRGHTYITSEEILFLETPTPLSAIAADSLFFCLFL